MPFKRGGMEAKMKKRILMAFMAVTLLSGLVSGCGAADKNDTKQMAMR